MGTDPVNAKQMKQIKTCITATLSRDVMVSMGAWLNLREIIARAPVSVREIIITRGSLIIPLTEHARTGGELCDLHSSSEPAHKLCHAVIGQLKFHTEFGAYSSRHGDG